MKKITLLLIVLLFASYLKAGSCSETANAFGQDDGPTTVLINSFPCLGGATPTGVSIDASIGGSCPSWYDYDIYINGALAFSNQCNLTGFDISAFMPITSVELRSRDNDAFSDGITLSLTVIFDYVSDDPCSANTLSVNCGQEFSGGTNVGTTNSGIANPGCGNYAGGDAWFKATVPASGELAINTIAGSLSDMSMALYSGMGGTPCSSLSLISCSDGGSGMPSITESGLTAGSEVFIRVWDENNNQTGTFEIAVTDPTVIYCLEGTAIEIIPPGWSAADNCAQLTAAVNAQNGCVWNNTQIDFSQTFDYSFTMYFGDNPGGADGCTFTLQNQGTSGVCGQSGGGLGASGITPSLIIEFDTWENGMTSGPNDPADLGFDHIAIEVDGETVNDSYSPGLNPMPQCGPIAAIPGGTAIEDGLEHDIRITWDPTTQDFRIFFDGVMRLSCNYDMINNIFGGDPTVYWGFTGSTGGFNNQQYFCPGTLPVTLGVEFENVDVICNDGKSKIVWKTKEIEHNSKFIIEKSNDAKHFEEYYSFTPNLGETNFEWSDHNITNSYYRIKHIDEDGVSQSNVLSTNCSQQNQISFYPNPATNQLTFVDIQSKCNVRIINSIGKTLDVFEFNGNQMTETVSLTKYEKGIYIVEFDTDINKTYQKLIVK